jgi:predicted ATPase
VAYTPLVSLLRNDKVQARLTELDQAWLVELTRLLPELKVKHPDLPDPEELTEGWQRTRLFEACARAILGNKGRLVILLDDLHWCDRETLAWLRYMMEMEKEAKLLFLGGIRAEDLTPEHPVSSLITDLGRSGLVSEIELNSLDQEATLSLAASVWGDALEDSVGEQLFQETEGNPLFVVEVVRSGYIRALEDPDRRSEIPPKVQAVIKSRLEALSSGSRELTNLAAVLGREFDYHLLAEAAELDQESILNGLDELWQRRVIRDQGEGGYDFSHEMFREVITGELSPHRQRHLHLRIAQALERLH